MGLRSFLPALLIVLAILSVIAIIRTVSESSLNQERGLRDFSNTDLTKEALGRSQYSPFGDPKFSLFHDRDNSYVIAKPLGNETVRHLLGQSTWRLIHTTMARFPLMPSENEKQALSQFLFLLSRLYPCGDCAEHFQKLLHEFPPNLNTRYEAELWACEAHNKVNKRLEKELLDCTTVHSLYDCGCKS